MKSLGQMFAGRLFFLGTVIIIVFAVGIPFTVHAAGTAADAMCVIVTDKQCPCTQQYYCDKNGCGCKGPQKNYWMCPCSDLTSGGKTSGHCYETQYCHGETTSGSAGQSGGQLGMQQLMQALSGLMSALGKGGGSGSGGSGSGSGGSTTGCTVYYETNDANSTDPCAYYVASATSTTQYYNSSADQVNSNSNSNTTGTSSTEECTDYYPTNDENNTDPCTYYVPPAIRVVEMGDSSTTSETTGTSSGIEEVGDTGATGQKANANSNDQNFITKLLKSIAGLGGSGGNIQVSDNGITIYAGSTDKDANTGVAGFYGSDTFGNESGGIVANLCRTRPWASGLVSAIISPTFFDNLCKWRGYQVGESLTSSDGSLIRLDSILLKNGGISGSTSSAPIVLPTPATANIWAIPASVSVGARTAVFWTTKLVQSCVVTSSDGSFRETALAGGASTVPLAGATTFTITCTALDGTQVSSSVLVTIKI